MMLKTEVFIKRNICLRTLSGLCNNVRQTSEERDSLHKHFHVQRICGWLFITKLQLIVVHFSCTIVRDLSYNF